MCIIIHKDAGVKAPTEEVLKRCLSTHKDGFGAMWRVDDKIAIQKGLYNLKEVVKLVNRLPVDTEAAFHFRMATHGKVSAGNCHPFPISKHNEALTSTAGYFPTGLMHNGIIYGFGSRNTGTQSDTMNFIKYLSRRAPALTMGGMQRHIKGGYGKFVIFTPWGTYKFGHFIEEKGLFYSNNTYKDLVVWDNWGKWGKFKDRVNEKPKNYIPYSHREPQISIVDASELSWATGCATYQGKQGTVHYYKGVTIFAELGYDFVEMEILKEEIEISLKEGEYEGP